MSVVLCLWYCSVLLHVAEHEVMCVFKALQSERSDYSDLPSDCLSAEEFSHLFEYLGMKWSRVS